MPLFETLIAPQNVIGLWTVISATNAALITLLGIFLNNLYENKRKREDRKHKLIRDAYMGGIEYLSYSQNKINSFSKNGTLEVEDHDREYSEKFYKLFAIASPEVIDIYSKLSAQYGDCLFTLGKDALLLQECSGKVAFHKQGIDIALEGMKIATENMHEYNAKKEDIPDLWALHTEQYNKSCLDFEAHSEQHDSAHKEELILRIKLLKNCMKALLDTTKPTYAALASMREELDRNLSQKDFKKIQKSIDFMQEKIERASNAFIKEIEDKIAIMEQAV
ncbi:hypothetical protein [Micavibrio aeruginosavorus]|nr:hypothetical protein [Micavibrio aeruginosavorus]